MLLVCTVPDSSEPTASLKITQLRRPYRDFELKEYLERWGKVAQDQSGNDLMAVTQNKAVCHVTVRRAAIQLFSYSPI